MSEYSEVWNLQGLSWHLSNFNLSSWRHLFLCCCLSVRKRKAMNPKSAGFLIENHWNMWLGSLRCLLWRRSFCSLKSLQQEMLVCGRTEDDASVLYTLPLVLKLSSPPELKESVVNFYLSVLIWAGKLFQKYSSNFPSSPPPNNSNNKTGIPSENNKTIH